jgi:predicted SAM-dependent methyltransferase
MRADDSAIAFGGPGSRERTLQHRPRSTQTTNPVPSDVAQSIPAGPKLNLGCGPLQPLGWVNVDASHRARLSSSLPWIDRALTRLGILPPTEFGPQVTVCNLLKPFPWPPNTVACVYAGELWEHFEYPDAVRATRECFRILAPSGVLRICVPDGPEFWRKYLERFDNILAKPKHERSAEPLREWVGMYFREINTRRRVFRSMGYAHKWQFDEVQLVELLESEGFVSVSRMRLHESRIPDVRLVERSNFLIVEGVKPVSGG